MFLQLSIISGSQSISNQACWSTLQPPITWDASAKDKSNQNLSLRALPCTGGREKHDRGVLAERCAFSSGALNRFGLAQFMWFRVSWGLRQIWDPKPPFPTRRAQMSALVPYTESVKPVKSVKAGVWQWLTIPNSAVEFCIDDSAFPCSVLPLLTLPARMKRKTHKLQRPVETTQRQPFVFQLKPVRQILQTRFIWTGRINELDKAIKLQGFGNAYLFPINLQGAETV